MGLQDGTKVDSGHAVKVHVPLLHGGKAHGDAPRSQVGTNHLLHEIDGGTDTISIVSTVDNKAETGKKRRPRRERKRTSVVSKVRNAVKGGGIEKNVNAVPIHEYVPLTEMDIEALLETLQRKGPKDLTTDMSAR